MSQDDWNNGFIVGVIAGNAPMPNIYYGQGDGLKLVKLVPLSADYYKIRVIHIQPNAATLTELFDTRV